MTEDIKQVAYISHFHKKVSDCKIHLTYKNIDSPIDIFDRETYKKLSDYKNDEPKPLCNSNIANYCIPIDITYKKNLKYSLICYKCFKHIYKKKYPLNIYI